MNLRIISLAEENLVLYQTLFFSQKKDRCKLNTEWWRESNKNILGAYYALVFSYKQELKPRELQYVLSCVKNIMSFSQVPEMFGKFSALFAQCYLCAHRDCEGFLRTMSLCGGAVQFDAEAWPLVLPVVRAIFAEKTFRFLSSFLNEATVDMLLQYSEDLELSGKTLRQVQCKLMLCVLVPCALTVHAARV